MPVFPNLLSDENNGLPREKERKRRREGREGRREGNKGTFLKQLPA